jgi:LacI family transcriptional regulator
VPSSLELEVPARPGDNPAATIKDVARLSGFSTSTVSRALTASGHVDPRTRELIRAVARDLGYRPDAAARTLVTSRSNVIGVVLSTFDRRARVHHPFLQELLEGMKFRAGESGYDIMLLAGRLDATPEEYVDQALRRRVDGVVLLSVNDEEREVRALAEESIPTVGIDVDVRAMHRESGFVTSDNVMGARLAVRHLLALGRTRVACIAGLVDTPPGRERLLGYREELEASGIGFREEYVAQGRFDHATGYRSASQLLSLREPPDAIFATSDVAAVGALDALIDEGVAVPGDVALVGYDDIALASIVRPSLTTVRQRKDELGDAAISMLIELMRNKEDAELLHVEPVELVVRQTTAAPSMSARAAS